MHLDMWLPVHTRPNINMPACLRPNDEVRTVARSGSQQNNLGQVPQGVVATLAVGLRGPGNRQRGKRHNMFISYLKRAKDCDASLCPFWLLCHK